MNALMDTLRTIGARLRRSGHAARALVAAVAVPAVAALVLMVALAPALNATSRIPVAVVNLDQGAVDDSGKQVQAGSDFVDSLADSEELAWDVVDESTADEGLANGTYELILEIPADYSQKVASLSGSTPERAQLNIISDGTTNVLATQAGSAVLRQVQSRLRSDLGKNYLLGVLNDVRGQASTLTLTADGSVMLDSAYDALEQGTSALATGLEQTAAGTDALAQGVGGIATGVTAAGTGAQQLAAGMDATSSQLVEPLAAGAQGVATGVAATGDGVAAMGSAVSSMGSALQDASDVLGESIDDLSDLNSLLPTFSEQATTLGEALDGMSQASQAVQTSADGLVDSVGDARASVQDASDAAEELAQKLSSSDGTQGDPGIVQQLNELNGQYDNLEKELRTLLTDTSSGGVTGGAVTPEQAQEILGSLDDLATKRAALLERANAAAEDAQEVADQTASASTALGGLEEQQQAMGAAAESYRTASASATGAATELSSLAGQMAEPASNVLYGAMVARETLNQTAPLLEGMGGQLSQAGSALSADGLLGQGAQGIATGTAALPQVLDTFSAATAGIGQGNIALGQALSAVGTGVSGLGEGIGAMADAQGQLASGVGQLHQGQQTINDTLSSAGDTLSQLSSSYDDRADVASAPVSLTTTARNRVEGTASMLAPVVAAAVLWAGAVLTAFVVPAVDARAVLAGRTVVGVLPAFATACGIGLLQALVIALAVIVLCGALPASMSAFVLLVVLGSVAYAALAQAVRMLCGRGAPVVLVAVLVLQLVCAGSILPASFAGGVFAALGSVLPVSVLAEALRGAVSGSLAGLGGACVVLAVWCLIALAVTFVSARARTNIRPERAFAG